MDISVAYLVTLEFDDFTDARFPFGSIQQTLQISWERGGVNFLCAVKKTGEDPISDV